MGLNAGVGVSTPFGFWDFPHSLQWNMGRIDPLDDYHERINSVRQSDRAEGGWYYAPLVEADSHTGRVLVSVERFELASTHTITATDASGTDEYLDFVIALAGMLHGLRLVREGWGHFHEIPIARLGNISDLLVRPIEVPSVIETASRWWQAANIEARGRMFGAIHWFCFSVSYGLEFNSFAARYTVLDALWAIHKSSTGLTKRVSHAGRLPILAASYGLVVPQWASLLPGKPPRSEISELRNELVHEARFAGQPIGFATPSAYEPQLSHQLGSFVCRLILAMLRVEADYVSSDVGSGMLTWLGLKHRSPTASYLTRPPSL